MSVNTAIERIGTSTVQARMASRMRDGCLMATAESFTSQILNSTARNLGMNERVGPEVEDTPSSPGLHNQSRFEFRSWRNEKSSVLVSHEEGRTTSSETREVPQGFMARGDSGPDIEDTQSPPRSC
jgi:hypothetical protein